MLTNIHKGIKHFSLSLVYAIASLEVIMSRTWNSQRTRVGPGGGYRTGYSQNVRKTIDRGEEERKKILPGLGLVQVAMTDC